MVKLKSSVLVLSDLERYSAVGLDGTVYTLAGELELRTGHTEPLHYEETVAAFKAAMRLLATGVVMVTTHVEGRPWGLTISACCSVSATPPQLLVSLSRHTVSARAIIDQGAFGVSVLGADQIEVAEYGAVPQAPKFVDAACHGGHGSSAMRTPMIAGCLCHAHCRTARVYDGGDHALIVGAVESIVVGPGAAGQSPLLYFDGGFRLLGEAIDRPRASRNFAVGQ